jgi:peptide/nickel transport system permease protein
MTTAQVSPKPIKLSLAQAEIKPQTPTQRVIRRFVRHRAAMFGLVILIGVLLYIIGGSFFVSEAYANRNDTGQQLLAPSAEHPFGTDRIGRDLLARTIYGGQISLMVGLLAGLVEVTLGVTIGAVAGYYGGWIDSLLMRFTEAMLSIPSLLLLLVMAKNFSNKIDDIPFLGRTFSGSVIVIIVIIGITSWMALSRIVRSNVLSLKETEFILAARALGLPNSRIILAHILPNTFASVIVALTLGIGTAILSEAYVSFLGLGVQAPTASWGNILNEASEFRIIADSPWYWFFPGLLIVLTVLGINFVGDGLRDALDPRSDKKV